MIPSGRLLVLLLSMAVVVAACVGADGDGSSFEPRLRWLDACPASVEVTFVSRHRCGYLTVLQDRAEPDGRTVELLVVKVWPVGVEPRPGIGSGFGANIGDPRRLSGDEAAGATRVRLVGVAIEQRGAGPDSEPSLACPEVDTLDRRGAAARTGDPGLLAGFLDAVRACWARLTSQGIDPADFDGHAAAADVEDLRVALGLDRWAGLGSEGTTSRFVFEYLRAFPGRVDQVVLDSPWFPDLDQRTGAIEGTRSALGELFHACADDPRCAEAYPNLRQTWSAALRRLSERPLQGQASTTGGDLVPITIDAGKLLRVARFVLGGDGPGNLARLPAMIAEAADGRIDPRLGEIVANDPLFCTGYRPFCKGQDGFGLGVFLTTFCQDIARSPVPEAPTSARPDQPIYEEVFLQSPYVSACEVWDVSPGGEPTDETFQSDVPMLFLTGQFDSFSRPDVARAEAARLPSAWAVEAPGQTHNVLGFHDCPIAIRNAWTFVPGSAPTGLGCLEEMPPPAWFVDATPDR